MNVEQVAREGFSIDKDGEHESEYRKKWGVPRECPYCETPQNYPPRVREAGKDGGIYDELHFHMYNRCPDCNAKWHRADAVELATRCNVQDCARQAHIYFEGFPNGARRPYTLGKTCHAHAQPVIDQCFNVRRFSFDDSAINTRIMIDGSRATLWGLRENIATIWTKQTGATWRDLADDEEFDKITDEWRS